MKEAMFISSSTNNIFAIAYFCVSDYKYKESFFQIDPVRWLHPKMIHFQKRNLGIEKIEKAEIDFTRNDLDTDTGKTFFLKAQKFGRTDRDIDDTALAERPAVGDTDDHPLHIGQIGDTQKSAERIGPVGSDQLVRIMDPATGSLTPVETVVVIRSKPFLLAPHFPLARESDQQEKDMYQTEGHTHYRFTLQ